MEKELHLFIIWNNAYSHKDEILKDIKENFTIRNIFEIKWSEEFFNSNLTRFYGTSLPKGCDKEKHIGRDKFLLVIVEVSKPRYEKRNTSHGECAVCIDMFDKKNEYRQMTAGRGSHMIHATNTVEEFCHDITLLLGINPDDYVKKYKKSSKIISLNQDIIGANKKWNSLTELFYILNNTVKYVVLRDFENDLAEIFNNSDADLLTFNRDDFIYICNGDIQENNVIVNINNKNCIFDIKDQSDNYYPNNMCHDILDKRVLNGFYYVPSQEYHYYSCLYHALFHKDNFESEYNERLENVFGKSIHSKENDKKYYIDLISDWMKKNKYDIVIYLKDVNKNNIENIKMSKLCNNKLLEEYDKLIESKGNYEYKIMNYIKKYPDNYEAVFEEDSSWPILYNLSNIRKNIIKWYLFKKDCKILEFDAEMGALTDELCKKAKKVTSIVASNTKAGIVKLRNKNNSNLEIVVGNYKDIELKEKYDYIFLNSSFAQSSLYLNSNNPYVDLLNNLKTHLSKDGKILITIENRFGLKYWCGAKEDHTGLQFDGIVNYVNSKNVKTFSKKELESIAEECNMYSNFYYVFPDYKFPQIIYSDKSLVKNNYLSYTPYYYEKMFLSIPESKVFKDIFDNNVIPFFANSYFVELSTKKEEVSVDFVKFNDFRKDKYNLFTYCLDDKYYKKPSFEYANDFYTDYGKSSIELNQQGFKTIDVLTDDIGYYTKKVTNPTFLDTILKEYKENGEKSLIDNLIKYKNYIELKYSNSIATYSDNVFEKYKINISKNKLNKLHFIKKLFIDIIPQNMIIQDGDYYLIDQEWTLFNAPYEFLLYRAIISIIYKNDNIDKNLKKYLELFNIGDYEEEFAKLEAQFQLLVSKENYKYIKEYCNFSLITDEIEERNKMIVSMNSANKELREKIENVAKDNDSLNERIRNVAADNDFLNEKIKEIGKENSNLNIMINEANNKNENLNQLITDVAKDNDNLNEKIKEIGKENSNLNYLLNESKENQKRLEEKNKELTKELNIITNSRSWKITKPLRSIGEMFKNKNNKKGGKKK